MDGKGPKAVLCAAINDLSTALEEQVRDGKQKYEQSERDIVSFCKSGGPDNLRGILTLYPVQDYAQCFRKLEITSRMELETLWSKYLTDESIRNSVDRLLSAEDNYRRLISELDQDCKTLECKMQFPVARVGDHLQKEITFMEPSSGKEITLSEVLQKAHYTLLVLRKHFV